MALQTSATVELTTEPHGEEVLYDWLLIDTVRVTEFLKLIYQDNPEPDYHYIFKNTEFDYLIDHSPVLVKVIRGGKLHSLWQGDKLISSSAIMLTTNGLLDMPTLLIHLYNLMRVQVSQETLLLRYYTKRLWEALDGKIEDKDKNTLLGPMSAISWINKDNQVTAICQDFEQCKLPLTPYTLTSPAFFKWI